MLALVSSACVILLLHDAATRPFLVVRLVLLLVKPGVCPLRWPASSTSFLFLTPLRRPPRVVVLHSVGAVKRKSRTAAQRVWPLERGLLPSEKAGKISSAPAVLFSSFFLSVVLVDRALLQALSVPSGAPCTPG